MAFLFVLKYVLSTCKTLFLESRTASTTMFSLLIPYLAPFFGIFHPRHQITGENITYIHSTHTPHAGRDPHEIKSETYFGNFYSHTSCEARLVSTFHMEVNTNFYSHASVSFASAAVISTHTPLARRDCGRYCKGLSDRHFYSHAPCGARQFESRKPKARVHFYSHASCEARPLPDFLKFWTRPISTHTPLARRDLRLAFATQALYENFYSHASCEARQVNTKGYPALVNFYSHASCEARLLFLRSESYCMDFYSHASCEARRRFQKRCKSSFTFLLTRLLRGATGDSMP